MVNVQFILFTFTRIIISWDRAIITDRTVVAIKPDTVVVYRIKRRAIVVDITIPHDENLVKVEIDKQLKYIT